ncbi:hypothetical protein HZS_4728 [Henneguya salminicola]|nr:hypothetical protein HZS_4728 [Henneguya salminicola]
MSNDKDQNMHKNEKQTRKKHLLPVLIFRTDIISVLFLASQKTHARQIKKLTRTVIHVVITLVIFLR